MATVFSVAAMIGVAVDVLHMPPLAAWTVAGFLEAAMFAAYLRARKLTVRGHSAGKELLTTWVFSALSGVFAGLHEVIHSVGDTAVWNFSAAAVFAAIIRLTVPLAACWGWHATLHAVAGEDRPTQRQERIDRTMWRVAVAARHVRDAHPVTRGLWRWRLRRAQEQLMRIVPPTSPEMTTLDAWLGQMRMIDELPGMTRAIQGESRGQSVAAFMAAPATPGHTVAATVAEPAITGQPSANWPSAATSAPTTGQSVADVTGHLESGHVVAAEVAAPVATPQSENAATVVACEGQATAPAATLASTGHSQAGPANAVISDDDLAGEGIGLSHTAQTGHDVAVPATVWPPLASVGRTGQKAARLAAVAEILAAGGPGQTSEEILAALAVRGIESSERTLRRDRNDLSAANGGHNMAAPQLVAV